MIDFLIVIICTIIFIFAFWGITIFILWLLSLALKFTTIAIIVVAIIAIIGVLIGRYKIKLEIKKIDKEDEE